MEAFKNKNWENAEAYLNRALAVEPTSPIILYAKAAYLYAPERTSRDWQAAELILKDLMQQGILEPAIFLLLADIAQYDKNNIDETVLFLRRYLDLYYNPSVEIRLKNLGK